jgi:hypothetical protein
MIERQNEEVVYRFTKGNDSDVCLRLYEFKDRRYIDLRIFFLPKDQDQMIPTKKGIALELAHLRELKKGIQACEKRAAALEGVRA